MLIEYSSYVGNWIAVQGNTEIRVQISSVLDNRVWGSAEVHSLTSDRVADIDFSGPLDQNGTLTCSYSEDGWGAKGLLKLTLQNRSVHLYTQETGYSSDYTGEWSFGNQNVIPGGSDSIQVGDNVIVITRSSNVNDLNDIFE